MEWRRRNGKHTHKIVTKHSRKTYHSSSHTHRIRPENVMLKKKLNVVLLHLHSLRRSVFLYSVRVSCSTFLWLSSGGGCGWFRCNQNQFYDFRELLYFLSLPMWALLVVVGVFALWKQYINENLVLNIYQHSAQIRFKIQLWENER